MQSYAYASIPVNVVSPACNFDSFFNQLPGEVGSSVYPVYNPYSGHPSYATPRPVLQPQHDINQHVVSPPLLLIDHAHRPQLQSSPVRRRSSATYHPYHLTTQHETTRSPTRARFHIPGPIAVVQNVDIRDVSISPTRAQRLAALLKTDPLNRNKNRNVPSEAEVESLSHLSHRKPILRDTPTHHNLVPQALFKEPKCAELFFFRHTPIAFNLRNVPKAGVKAGDMLGAKPPKLDGDDDFVLKDIKEREFRVQILWPGYKTFEKRIKTHSPQNEQRTRSFIALRLAYMLLDFRKQIMEHHWEVEVGQEDWKLSTGPNDLGINVEDLMITQMVHCGGSHWQMELWAPGC